MNVVTLIGNLGKDPESRIAPSGTVITNFTIATQERVKVNDAWTTKPEWHNIVAFGKTAELAGRFLKAGNKVAILGRLQTSSWEDQQGVKKYKTEIVVNELTFLTPKSAEPVDQPPVEDFNVPGLLDTSIVSDLNQLKDPVGAKFTSAEGEEDDLPF